MKNIQNLFWIMLFFSCFFAKTSHAVVADLNMNSETMKKLQLYSGNQVRQSKRMAYKVVDTPLTKQAWNRFVLNYHDATWKGLWDKDTGVPLRIYGSGISAPNTVASAIAAEEFSNYILANELALLAPGSNIDDFTLVSNTVHNGVRVVGYEQSYSGIKVLGGQLSFRFKNDSLIVLASEAYPDVKVIQSSNASIQLIELQALKWIQNDIDSQSRQTKEASEPIILPLVLLENGSSTIEYKYVRRVMVKSDQPMGLWEVYVDADSGHPVARKQKLMFATSQAFYNTPVRWPGDLRQDYPAGHATIDVDGNNVTTNAEGEFSWNGTKATVLSAISGPFVSVINDAGSAASAGFPITDGNSFIWSEPTIEFTDAQITAFVHANRAKDYVRPWNPGLTWLNQTMPVTVNIEGSCNAASNGDGLFFLVEGLGCSNTARLTDIVYHEFGHSLHRQSIIPGVGAFDGSMSEGAGDFLAATIVNDSATGIGFFLDGNPLREIDPSDSEAVYPDDVSNDNHITGLIYAGAFWDLRKALIMELGQSLGRETTERLFYATLQRASNIVSAYVEVLVEDDDDGNLTNGTPNYCIIEEAFRIHGLTGSSDNPLFGNPIIKGLNVSVPSTNNLGCKNSVNSMTLEWRNRNNPAQTGVVSMNQIGTNFNATIPFNEPGEVVQYRILAEFSSGDVTSKPKNIADPWYETFIGIIETISCTDFETDPMLLGWTHELTAGTNQLEADDWEYGTPFGNSNNGDPTEAYSGVNVFGNDLGILQNSNGLYQPNITNEARSPVYDVSGYEHIRLQYQRWLNVEDGLYDKATIYANDVSVWSNLTSSGTIQHQDQEWRFHDIDLTSEVANNEIQLRFELSSDGGLEFGGWTIDDVCIIGYNGTPLSDVIFLSGFD